MDLARARHGGPRQYTPRMGVLIQKFRILQVFLVFSLIKILYIDPPSSTPTPEGQTNQIPQSRRADKTRSHNPEGRTKPDSTIRRADKTRSHNPEGRTQPPTIIHPYTRRADKTRSHNPEGRTKPKAGTKYRRPELHPPSPTIYPLYLPSRCLPTLIREHATPATTTMPRVASSDRLRRSICSNGLGVPKARSAATHTPRLPATSSSGATREGLSAGRLNARASTRMGRGTNGLTLPAALRLLRRLAESQWSVQLQAVVHLYIYTPRAEQRAPQMVETRGGGLGALRGGADFGVGPRPSGATLGTTWPGWLPSSAPPKPSHTHTPHTPLSHTHT